MKILFLCNKSPWPPREGGPMAMNMLVEGLIREGHQVRVLAVNSHKYNIDPADIPDDYRRRTGIELVDLDLRIKPAGALLSLLRGRSYHVSRFISSAFRKRLIRVLATTEFDIIQLETLFMCPYIPTIRERSHARITLRAHNIEHRIWERIAGETKNPLKRWYIRHLAKTLKHYELAAIRAVDGIVAITPEDARYFEARLPERDPVTQDGDADRQPAAIPVLDLPFGIEPDQYQPDPPPGPPSLFSLGSMNWLPNVEGIRWFLQHVWPDLHKEFPGLRYYLAGRAMPAWMTTLDLPGVVVCGEVPDAREFMASRSVMIVPLFSGSGIRVKIIEGMAAGKTIISTTIGAEGIAYTDRENILIADTACDFFEMVSLCLKEPDKIEAIGRQARLLAETAYDQRRLVKKLSAFYQQILT